MQSSLVFQIQAEAEKIFWVDFGGPIACSQGVWKPRTLTCFPPTVADLDGGITCIMIIKPPNTHLN